MKHASALLAALVITAVIGLGIFVIGVNALANTNTVPLQNSPNSAAAVSSSSNSAVNSSTSSSNVQQLQQEVSSLQAQLNQENQVLQQYQSLIQVLQQRGIIVIDQNGNIFIPRDDLH